MDSSWASQWYISIHALREEGDTAEWADKMGLLKISIHALREEGDKDTKVFTQTAKNFYPRPPRGGRPPSSTAQADTSGLFLSTPSARRATVVVVIVGSVEMLFLSTPSARRATKTLPRHRRIWPFLSTPSARRATGTAIMTGQTKSDFYPRPPRGGRRNAIKDVLLLVLISIHALREEGDVQRPGTRRPSLKNFYPRPPRGGRRTVAAFAARNTLFLSTPSARRATLFFGRRLAEHSAFLSTPSARRATLSLCRG